MNITPPKPITIKVAKMSMPDPEKKLTEHDAFELAQEIQYGLVVVSDADVDIAKARQSRPMADATPGCIREWNEKAEREDKRQREIAVMADHYFTSGFSFGDFMEALEECDQENRKRLLDLIRIKDDAAAGLQIRQIFEAYAWRFAEGEV